MEPFEVRLSEKTFGILPQHNGTFIISEEGSTIGTVYPEPGDLVLEWKSTGGLRDDLVDDLGEMISAYALGTV